jgi:hypothetical protein
MLLQSLPLLLLFAASSLGLVAAAAQTTCTTTADMASTRSGPQRLWLLNGFNQALGTRDKSNITFADASVARALETVGVGATRYPGGTVANYFNWTNGAVASRSAQHFGSGHPAFDVGNFTQHVSRRMLCPACVSYVLNVFTADAAASIALVDSLISAVGAANIRHIEIGNEFYLYRHYRDVIPNASAYVARARPVVRHIRRRLPDAQVSAMFLGMNVPYHRKPEYTAWNAGLVDAVRRGSPDRVFDAVVWHDYTMGNGGTTHSDAGRTPAQELSRRVGYGLITAHAVMAEVAAQYGPDVPVWVTEFDVAGSDVSPHIRWSLSHAMFDVSYVVAAVCGNGASARIDVLLRQVLWHQQWSHLRHNIIRLPNAADAPQAVEYGVVAQVHSMLWHLAVAPFDSVTCLRANGTACEAVESAAGYPVGTRCIHALRFANATATAVNASLWTVVVMNLCPGTVSDVSMPLAGAAGATVYDFGDAPTGFGFTSFAGCAGPLWAPTGSATCRGILRPHKQERGVPAGSDQLRVAVRGLRLVVVTSLPQ